MEPQTDTEQDEGQPQLPPEQFVAYVTGHPNLAANMDEARLGQIAQDVLSDYDLDHGSMDEWRRRMQRGLDLANLVKEDKSHPFQGAANIRYPTVTSAALQFNARSYPAIVPSDRIVKARVWGDDPGGQKAARAERISEHMSWQLAGNVVKEWEASTDRLLTQLPIVGEMFRKWWLDPVTKRPTCRLVKPGCLVVNDKVDDLENAPRVSEELPLYPHEIGTRVKSGQFVPFEYDDDPEDRHAPQDFIEQHTRLDLDEDGYPEPYVVTVHKDSQTVVRIVADFSEREVAYETEMQVVTQVVPLMDPNTGIAIPQQVQHQVEVKTGILAIERGTHFIDFQFMPSMDGGFHGTGLGLLLGDLAESIDSIINMMLDAGHYASLGGGWIGSEFRMKGGAQQFRPGEFKLAQSAGGDIRNAIVERTFPGPDAVLFQMLGMLIDASEKLSSTHAIMTGDDGGKNMQPTTIMALIEQGMKVFTAVYKRIFRSLKKEFRLLAQLNAQSVTPEEYNQFHDLAGHNGGPPRDDMQQQPQMLNPAEEYGAIGMDIQPVADPNSVVKSAELAKSQILMEWAQAGLVDPQGALGRALEAMDIEDSEELIPQPDPAEMQMQQHMMALQMQGAQADVTLKMVDIEKRMAEIDEIRSQAMKNMAEAQGEQAKLALENKKVRMDGLFKLLEEERERLAEVLRGPGGMAHQSGNGNAENGDGQRPAPGEGQAVRRLLGGAPSTGGIPGGGSSGGAMGGPVF